VTPDQQDAARQRFARAVSLYDEGDYKLALIEFTRAYEMARDYRLLYNIGHVHLQLGNYAKALRALTQYLEDGKSAILAERRVSVEREIASTRQRTATLTVRVSVADAQIDLDQDSLGRGPSVTQTVDGGEHRIRVSKAGFLPQDKAVVLAPGDVTDIYVALAPLQAPEVQHPATSHPEVWMSWTATGLLAAGAGVCGALALNDNSRLKTLRGTAGSSEADRQALASHADTLAIATDVLAGAALVGGGISLYLTLRRRSAEPIRLDVGASTIRIGGDF
jgi:tetratricopeptide (TPR) repeat protein